MILTFDETTLVNDGNSLTPELRIAFAALAAERIMPGVDGLAGGPGDSISVQARSILDAVWARLGEDGQPSYVRQQIESCMALLSQHAESWGSSRPFAEDALSAIAYTLRCESTGMATEAAYAARRGYEAVDKYVVQQLDVDLNSPGAEKIVLADPRIQAELQFQRTDMRALQQLGSTAGLAVAALRQRAVRNAHRFVAGK